MLPLLLWKLFVPNKVMIFFCSFGQKIKPLDMAVTSSQCTPPAAAAAAASASAQSVEDLIIAHQYQITKNSIELTWYAILRPDAEYLTSYEVEILSDTSDVLVGYVSQDFVDMRKSLARTVQVPINMAAAKKEGQEVRGRVRVKGATSSWSVWCPYKVTKLQ